MNFLKELFRSWLRSTTTIIHRFAVTLSVKHAKIADFVMWCIFCCVVLIQHHITLMARKKKDDPVKVTDKPDGYEVFIGYIKKFEYYEEVNEDMLGHPKQGRVYRIIKNDKGYRLHIGRENNRIGLDGLFLGDSLAAVKPTFSFEIILVTVDNYLDLKITKEDSVLLSQWIHNDNSDMWDIIKLEAKGDATVLHELSDVLSSRKEEEEHIQNLIDIIKQGDPDDKPNPDNQITIIPDTSNITNAEIDAILSSSLSMLSRKDPELFLTLLFYLQYLGGSLTNDRATIMENISTRGGDIAKGGNMCQIIESAERYFLSTHRDGLNDIYNIIKYALFELQRRRYLNESSTD